MISGLYVLSRTGLLLVVLYLVLLIMVKVKYPFWSRQPVFHFHNLYYWISPPGIISHQSPKRDRFFDSDVYFDSVKNVSKGRKKDFVRLVQRYYLRRKEISYTPSSRNIFAYLDNTNSYLAMKYNGESLLGAITGRPLLCCVDGNSIVG